MTKIIRKLLGLHQHSWVYSHHKIGMVGEVYYFRCSCCNKVKKQRML